MIIFKNMLGSFWILSSFTLFRKYLYEYSKMLQIKQVSSRTWSIFYKKSGVHFLEYFVKVFNFWILLISYNIYVLRSMFFLSCRSFCRQTNSLLDIEWCSLAKNNHQLLQNHQFFQTSRKDLVFKRKVIWQNFLDRWNVLIQSDSKDGALQNFKLELFFFFVRKQWWFNLQF